ncbi:hypothetical protein BLA18112_03862 [Burkholderia lata]|uniref:Uncharacterized protein n=1 Tax=Burkholderia lata (strain ATCC 17760 / DSM 23089 / LMG 22485 / NCIMB 9086 / R18194 / 383) TaxID=482957 RepID=A0A6P2WQN5_BURL3|nr:hypothetical protein BLA18112_03862 [Burkholderia lata]
MGFVCFVKGACAGAVMVRRISSTALPTSEVCGAGERYSRRAVLRCAIGRPEQSRSPWWRPAACAGDVASVIQTRRAAAGRGYRAPDLLSTIGRAARRRGQRVRVFRTRTAPSGATFTRPASAFRGSLYATRVRARAIHVARSACLPWDHPGPPGPLFRKTFLYCLYFRACNNYKSSPGGPGGPSPMGIRVWQGTTRILQDGLDGPAGLFPYPNSSGAIVSARAAVP